MTLLPTSVETAKDLRIKACYGVPITLFEGLDLILADNAADYTGAGTNTYILGREKLWIIDPGPKNVAHVEAVVAAVSGREVMGVLVTHSHLDHSPAAAMLRDQLGCKIYANASINAHILAESEEDIDPDFEPDHLLFDGDVLDQGDDSITVFHTPGHFPNHLAFYVPKKDILFTGDHIMGWSTTVIVPPLGDLAEYMESLKRLEAIDCRLMLPSHGPMIDNPAGRCAELRAHRLTRHKMIMNCVADGYGDPTAIRQAIYPDLPARLEEAATGQVRAHLEYATEMEELCSAPELHYTGIEAAAI